MWRLVVICCGGVVFGGKVIDRMIGCYNSYAYFTVYADLGFARHISHMLIDSRSIYK